LAFLPATVLAEDFLGFSSAEAPAEGALGAGVLPGKVLSVEGTKMSGVSESVDGASAVRVSTVIFKAISS
jgi:hypothetical protein